MLGIRPTTSKDQLSFPTTDLLKKPSRLITKLLMSFHNANYSARAVHGNSHRIYKEMPKLNIRLIYMASVLLFIHTPKYYAGTSPVLVCVLGTKYKEVALLQVFLRPQEPSVWSVVLLVSVREGTSWRFQEILALTQESFMWKW